MKDLRNRIEELQNIVGTEFNFRELDKEMMNNGFYSTFDDGLDWNEIAESGNIVYTDTTTNEAAAHIHFVVIDNGNTDEYDPAFEITFKVTAVEEF